MSHGAALSVLLSATRRPHGARLSQSTTLLLVGGIFLGIVVLLALAMYFAPSRRLKRKLRAMPVVRIADAPQGVPVRIAGAAAVLQDQLVTPFGGRPCVYYAATVQQRRGSGQKAHWVTICAETRGVRFAVDDGSGRAVVDPTAGKVALASDGTSRSGTLDNPTEAEAAFLARNGVKASGLFGLNKSLQYSEQSITVGERISVSGSAARDGGPAPSLTMAGTPQAPLLITDDKAIAAGR